MDRKSSAGKVLCRICGKAYQTTITFLTDPIDVYSEWIDECQKENEGEKPDDYDDEEEEEEVVQSYSKSKPAAPAKKPTKKPQKPQSDEEDEDEEDNSDNDPDLFLKKHSK
jgi:transcription elongation factor Elf1